MSSGQQYQSRKATVIKEGGTCNARKYTGKSGGSQFRIVVTGEECHPCFTAFDVQKTLTVKLLAVLQQSKALKTALGGVQLLKVHDIDRMMRDISQTSVHNRPLFQTTIIPSLSSDKLPRPRPLEGCVEVKVCTISTLGSCQTYHYSRIAFWIMRRHFLWCQKIHFRCIFN